VQSPPALTVRVLGHEFEALRGDGGTVHARSVSDCARSVTVERMERRETLHPGSSDHDSKAIQHISSNLEELRHAVTALAKQV
jgi:hypothetical protein